MYGHEIKIIFDFEIYLLVTNYDEFVRYQWYGILPLELVIFFFDDLNFQQFKNSISAELVFRRIFLKVRFEMKN